jgi:hypothetical protein
MKPIECPSKVIFQKECGFAADSGTDEDERQVIASTCLDLAVGSLQLHVDWQAYDCSYSSVPVARRKQANPQ